MLKVKFLNQNLKRYLFPSPADRCSERFWQITQNYNVIVFHLYYTQMLKVKFLNQNLKRYLFPSPADMMFGKILANHSEL